MGRVSHLVILALLLFSCCDFKKIFQCLFPFYNFDLIFWPITDLEFTQHGGASIPIRPTWPCCSGELFSVYMYCVKLTHSNHGVINLNNKLEPKERRNSCILIWFNMALLILCRISSIQFLVYSQIKIRSSVAPSYPWIEQTGIWIPENVCILIWLIMVLPVFRRLFPENSHIKLYGPTLPQGTMIWTYTTWGCLHFNN